MGEGVWKRRSPGSFKPRRPLDSTAHACTRVRAGRRVADRAAGTVDGVGTGVRVRRRGGGDREPQEEEQFEGEFFMDSRVGGCGFDFAFTPYLPRVGPTLR